MSPNSFSIWKSIGKHHCHYQIAPLLCDVAGMCILKHFVVLVEQILIKFDVFAIGLDFLLGALPFYVLITSALKLDLALFKFSATIVSIRYMYLKSHIKFIHLFVDLFLHFYKMGSGLVLVEKTLSLMPESSDNPALADIATFPEMAIKRRQFLNQTINGLNLGLAWVIVSIDRILRLSFVFFISCHGFQM